VVVPLVAGSGLRPAEVFGLEVEHLGFDLHGRQVLVRQQLITPNGGPPYLDPQKTDESERDVPLAQVTLAALAAHLAEFPAREVDIEDRTNPRKPYRRTARLVFTLDDGRLVKRKTWSRLWTPAVAAAGLPKRTGLHTLRHL
jgi:integrase